jgi:hypothetical protein
MEAIDISQLTAGEYIFRIFATDLADNEAVLSRNIIVAVDDSASEIALFNPMPGEQYSGPLNVSGRVSGAVVPKQVTININHHPVGFVDVDRYGIFRYQHPEEKLGSDAKVIVSASYDTPTGKKVVSKDHTVYYSVLGPSIAIESHKDGDVITGRPYLTGRAWIPLAEPAEGEAEKTRKEIKAEKKAVETKEVTVSFDNGRSFAKAGGREDWKIRLETGDLPLGPLPVLIKAEFADGRNVVRRILLTVDTNAPQVETFEPVEDSTHRDNILVYGAASDDFELDSVVVSLRPGDKAGYSVPGFIQGMYLDANFLGATYIDGGLGLSFFKDNVKLQGQVGVAPSVVDGQPGRFLGTVAGVKLLANIFYMPFDYLFGPDWNFFSMSIALGANFSWFTMDPSDDRPSMFMGAVLGQWEFAKADMSYFVPSWKYLKTISLYFEPIWWFASSDVNAEPIFRTTFGIRMYLF